MGPGAANHTDGLSRVAPELLDPERSRLGNQCPRGVSFQSLTRATSQSLQVLDEVSLLPRGESQPYLKDKNVRGVLLWNTWGQVDNARAIIGTTKRLP